MHISSSTPEGEPQRCPVCGQETRIELSAVSEDAPCPHCGSLLWITPQRGAVHGRSRQFNGAIADVVAFAISILLAISLVPLVGLSWRGCCVLCLFIVLLYGRTLVHGARALALRIAAARYR